MNAAVRFHTRKLAEAVADAVAASAKDITVPLSEKADILFNSRFYFAKSIIKQKEIRQ